MRAAPIGLYFADDIDALVAVAAAQSALTHRHPTGIASSVAAAAAVAHAMQRDTRESMIAYVRRTVRAIDGALLERVGCPAELRERIGTTEMLAALDATEAALDQETDDVCALLGGAWIGEQAVATALWCAHRAGDSFSSAVLRGANSSGDSDSIACIAGAIAGARGGVNVVPPAWVSRVEKSSLLDQLAVALYDARLNGDRPLPHLDPYGAESHVTDAR